MLHMPPVHHGCSTNSIDHTCRHPNLGCADPTITSRKIPSLFTPGSHQDNDCLTNLCNHHTSCSFVNLQSGPKNWGLPFSTGWQQHASILLAERSHLGASLSRFWLRLNLKREMFLGRRGGNLHLLLADSKHPQMKHPDNVKGQQAELDAGCACFFPMQHEPAFQINPTASFPCLRNSSGWTRERFCFPEVETVK